MAKVADVTHDESIKENLEEWCYELETDYKQYSESAAKEFLDYVGKRVVVDLGGGDGAGANVFIANGNKVTVVDINQKKLDRVEGAATVCQDFLEFLSKPVGNLFIHHALEHYPDYEEVLKRIGKYLRPGCYCYIAVPAGDHLHSVHHVAFDSPEELVPPGLELAASGTRDKGNGWKEHYAITKRKKSETKSR
jgi:SAM-dependent methyltransferase